MLVLLIVTSLVEKADLNVLQAANWGEINPATIPPISPCAPYCARDRDGSRVTDFWKANKITKSLLLSLFKDIVLSFKPFIDIC